MLFVFMQIAGKIIFSLHSYASLIFSPYLSKFNDICNYVTNCRLSGFSFILVCGKSLTEYMVTE